jgi:hypothetical protein
MEMVIKMIKINKNNLIRWFKKGWFYSILTTIIGYLTATLGLKSGLKYMLETGTFNLTSLITLGILAIVWGFLVYPVISGWMVEFTNKKVK